MIEFEGKKLFIFDFDGTLFDTMHAWTGFGEDFVEYVGREPEKGLTDRLNSIPTLYAAAQFLHDNYCPELTSDEIFGWIGDHVRDYYENKAVPKKGVPEFLKKWRARGIRMCVLTANETSFVSVPLRRCGLEDFFDRIYSTRDLGLGKDTPDSFVKVLGDFGTEASDAVVFEDAFYAASNAAKLNIPIVGISDDTEPNSDEMKSLCDAYVSDFTELLQTV